MAEKNKSKFVEPLEEKSHKKSLESIIPFPAASKCQAKDIFFKTSDKKFPRGR